MSPTQTLPPGYNAYFTLDLSKNVLLVLLLNVIAFGLLIVFGFLFLLAARAILPAARFPDGGSVSWFSLIPILLSYSFVLVLHELVHGAFIWLFTRQRPRFGFKGAYAYAAAPDWYIPKRHYVVIGLSPLVVLSLLGLLLLPVLPPGSLLLWLVALTSNASGAIGDVLIVAWLLAQPDTVLIQDHGDAVTAFQPV